MDRRSEIARAPEGEGVADVADDAAAAAAVDGADVLPRPLGCPDLQARHLLRPQQRQRAEVRVRARPGVVHDTVVFDGPGVVQHIAQMVLALVVVAVAVDEEVLVRELEREGEEDEDLGDDVLVGFVLEGLDLGVEGTEEGVARLVGEGGDVFGDVDGFDVVEDGGAHDLLLVVLRARGSVVSEGQGRVLGSGSGLFTYASVSEVVPLLEIAAEALLRFLARGAVEVGLRYAILSVDFLVGQASACDAEEAIAVDAPAELGC